MTKCRQPALKSSRRRGKHEERDAGKQRAQGDRADPAESVHHAQQNKKGQAPGDGQEDVGGYVLGFHEGLLRHKRIRGRA
jgi:hypothetical protein